MLTIEERGVIEERQLVIKYRQSAESFLTIKKLDLTAADELPFKFFPSKKSL